MPGGNLIGNWMPSPKCIGSDDRDAIYCFAPTISPTGQIVLSFWVLDGTKQFWGIGDLGSDFSANSAGEIVSYDIECVPRAYGRIDCMELVGHAFRSGGLGYSSGSSHLRHYWWDFNNQSGWRDIGATPVTGSPNYNHLGLSCVSWDQDRLDCFAATGWLGNGPLFHTWYAKQPLHAPP
jgi:hypothetical protein